MEEMIKLISTYGLAIVISGLVIYFAVRFANIALERAAGKRAAEKHDRLEETRRRVSTTINSIIERVALVTRAGRVYVCEYHNGTVSAGGLPFVKMTCTYEALGEGAKSAIAMRTNMPVQLYTSLIDKLATEECVVIDVSERSDDFSLLVYETLAERSVAVTVRAKMTDIRKKVVGYVGVDYLTPVDVITIQECRTAVMETAKELGALLAVNNDSR